MGYTSRSDWLTEIPDIAFYGEVYGEVTIPTEVEIGLLLRSPNEHETKSKSFSMNMGNRDYASNDKYMRDSFSTSVIVRNLYYANQ
jgi:ribosomal protein S10